MEGIDLVDGAVEWRGVSWVDVGADGGVSPRRLPARYLRQVGALTALRANAACGARLAFRTDAPVIELRCWLATLTPGADVPAPVADLVVDGELVDTRGPTAGPTEGPCSGCAAGRAVVPGSAVRTAVTTPARPRTTASR